MKIKSRTTKQPCVMVKGQCGAPGQGEVGEQHMLGGLKSSPDPLQRLVRPHVAVLEHQAEHSSLQVQTGLPTVCDCSQGSSKP